MMMDLLGYFLLALVGILLSAVYSGLETGLYTINRVRLLVRAEHGEPAARRLRALIDRPSRMLGTLLIGNNIANYAGSFGIAAILDLYGVMPVSAILINVCILVPVLFIFGETLPKDLFRTHTDHWSYTMAGFLAWSDRILTWTGLSPIVHGFGVLVARIVGSPKRSGASDEATGDAVGRGESAGADTMAMAITGGARLRISQLIKEGVAAGVISEAQTTLADRALAMRELRVRDEMVPWREVITIVEKARPEQRTRIIERHPFSRLPVVDGRGRPIGVLSTLRALLEPERPIRDLMEPAIEVESRTAARLALRQMRERNFPMAIVTTRQGSRPIGLVTFKDLIEPLTGELRAW